MQRYSKLAFNNNQNTAYYYCSDIECKGRGYSRYSKNKKNQNEININTNENFIITKSHNIDYVNHNYIKYKKVLEDIKTKSFNKIKNKLKNYEYLSIFLKGQAILHNEKITTALVLENLFKEEYSNISINNIIIILKIL